jgi:hypothetical protein
LKPVRVMALLLMTTVSAAGMIAPGSASSAVTTTDSVASGQGSAAYPTAPTDLHITDSAQQTSLTAAWRAVTGASGYRVGRNGTALTDTPQTTYTWTGLTCATTYTLSVQPETSSKDTSGRVATVSGTTAACSPAKGGTSGSVVFAGDFENGSISRWQSTALGGAQCLNYGVSSDSGIARGSFYSVTDIYAKGRSSGRFDLPAAGVNNACELLRGRTIAFDDEWYSVEVRFPNDWREPSPAGWGMSLAQLNFENIWGSPLSLSAHANSVDLILNSGLCKSFNSRSPSCQYSSGIDGNVPRQHILPSSAFSTGVWHQFLIHVKWTNGNDGVVEGFHRLRSEATWTQTANITGYPTLQRTSTFTPTAADRTVDKIGAYRGAATFPLSIWQDSFCQATSRAAAEACF